MGELALHSAGMHAAAGVVNAAPRRLNSATGRTPNQAEPLIRETASKGTGEPDTPNKWCVADSAALTLFA